MMTLYFAGFPLTISVPVTLVWSTSKGMQRMVACVSSLIFASVSAVPSHGQRKKPPSLMRLLEFIVVVALVGVLLAEFAGFLEDILLYVVEEILHARCNTIERN